MREAYTLIYGWPTRHLDVGRTFKSREQAEHAAEESSFPFEVVEVTCHVEDFTSHGFAQFMIRTDGNHEISLVVDTRDSDNNWGLEYPENCRVSTQLVSEAEYDWGEGE